MCESYQVQGPGKFFTFMIFMLRFPHLRWSQRYLWIRSFSLELPWLGIPIFRHTQPGKSGKSRDAGKSRAAGKLAEGHLHVLPLREQIKADRQLRFKDV